MFLIQFLLKVSEPLKKFMNLSTKDCTPGGFHSFNVNRVKGTNFYGKLFLRSASLKTFAALNFVDFQILKEFRPSCELPDQNPSHLKIFTGTWGQILENRKIQFPQRLIPAKISSLKVAYFLVFIFTPILDNSFDNSSSLFTVYHPSPRILTSKCQGG